jgi:thymidylate synthase (FAD)
MNTAKIISMTQPMIEGVNTAEELLAYTARVSNPSNQMNHETSDKLLRYCIRKRHWSVFEQVSVAMQIDTTRDIARQILRHRSFSFQEFSQRYADPTQDLGMIFDREARLQDNKNRQNSIEINDADLKEKWLNEQSKVAAQSLYAYNWAIMNGIAKEQARVVLPEGMTISRLYMNGTLRSWITYYDVRSDPGTQKEHRDIAEAAWIELCKHFVFLREYEPAGAA